MKESQCDFCMFYEYDEEMDEHFCGIHIDQDDLEKLMYHRRTSCTSFRMGDEYTIVKKQGF